MCKYLLLFLSLIVGSPVIAQVSPGSEHKFLAESEGDWDVTIDMEGGAMKGTCKNKMAHGGLWLTSTLEMDMGGVKFTGSGMDSYDPVKKKYVGIWVDSMTTSPMTMEGELSKDGKKLTMSGKGPNESGKIVDVKTETEYVSKDKHVFKLWMGDLAGAEMMKATYTRKTNK